MNSEKMTPIELRASWGLGAVLSLRMIGIFMVLPILTIYGMQLKDANKMLIGLAIGIHGLMQAIFQIPCGLLSDRIGRKPLIISGLLIFVCGSVIAASSDSIWGIILGRALQGLGTISAAVMALLSDLTCEQNRTKAMVLIGISFGITFSISILLGPIIANVFGIHILFWIIAILASCGILIILTVVPNASHHTLNRESGVVKSNIREVLIHPQLFKLNISIFCLHALLILNFIILPIQLKYTGYPIEQHWKVYLTTILLSFIIIVPVIIFSEAKRIIRKVFISCVTLSLISEIIIWISGSCFWVLTIGTQLFFIAFNLLEIILPSLISKESPVGYKGTAMGIYSTTQFFGIAIGGSLGGWILDNFDTQMVFLLSTILTMFWLLLSTTIHEPPYVTSLRIVVNTKNMLDNIHLESLLKAQPGVSSVFIIPEEQSIYAKIDNKITNRFELEKLIIHTSKVK